MSLIPAKCIQCGADINVDIVSKSGKCPYCNTGYITENVVKNYITNVASQTNYYLGSNEFNDEKKQCKILLLLLKNLDFKMLKEQALKVLNTNPDNELALMVYNAHFNVNSFLSGNFIALDFDENVVAEYFNNHNGAVDIDFSLLILGLLLYECKYNSSMNNLFIKIIKNVESLNMSPDDIYKFYQIIVFYICNNDQVNKLKEIKSSNKVLAWTNIILTQNAATSTRFDLESDQAKKMIDLLIKTRKVFAKILVTKIKETKLDEKFKTMLLNDLKHQFPEMFNIVPMQNNCETSINKSTSLYSTESGLFLAILCLLTGYTGVHRFVVGKIGTGLIGLFTCGFCGVGVVVDLILILLGKFEDKDGKKVQFQWKKK